MSKKIEIPRQYIRYNRSDITVFIRERGKIFSYVELLNISQQGLSCRIGSSMKLKKRLELLIKFNESKSFELNGYIANKSKIESEEQAPFMERIWGILMPDHSFHNYGINFNEVNDDFKLFLLKSNMQKKLGQLSQ